MKKQEQRQICFYIFFGILFFWGLQHYQLIGSGISFVLSLLMPFLIGIAIAFVLNVPMTKMERFLTKKMKYPSQKKIRIFSVIFSLLLFLFLIAFVLFLVVPELIRTLSGMMDQVPSFLEQVKNFLTTTFPSERLEAINWESIKDQILAFSQDGIQILFTSSFQFVMTLIKGLVNIGMGTVFAIYMLLAKEKLINQFKSVLYACFKKSHIDRLCQIGKTANQTFTSFITGQCTEACILGTMFFVGMLVFRFPYALTISVLIAVTSLVPVFGATIAMVIGAFLIFLTSPMSALWFIVFFLVLQQIEGNLIYPRVVGKSVGLPPIWVMLAVLLGGSIGGILGMLVSVPLSAIAYSVLGTFVKERLQKKKLVIE